MRAILFDIGDTLFRLDPIEQGAIRSRFAASVAAHLEIEPDAAATLADNHYTAVISALRESYGTSATAEPSIASLAEPLFSTFGATAATLAAELDHILGEADTARWVRTPGREQHLARFAEAGLQLAFVSNTLTSPGLMRARLTEFGLLGHARVHVFSVALGERKPSPTIYRAALDGLGISPAEALFVGDRVREDILGPQSLGMKGVLTHEFRQEDPGQAKPHGIVRALPELWDLLE